jgi:hypothetical protein
LDAYIQKLRNHLDDFELSNIEVKNVEDIEVPLRVEFNVKSKQSMSSNFLVFNPLFITDWKKNPLISNERNYPVDFGAPLDEIIVVNITYPQHYVLKEVPERIGGLLPNQGGRFIVEFSNQPQRFVVNVSLQVLKSVYSSQEYHYLRALFGHVVSAANAQIVFEHRE